MLVNLYSDTQTRPSEAMRAAIASAEVGDEQRGEDPTTIEIERRVASLLGQEAAVFLPSGTMCNEIAIRAHVRPGGDEVFLGRRAHPIEDEAGGPAMLSGAVLTVLDGDRGTFTGAALDASASGTITRAPAAWRRASPGFLGSSSIPRWWRRTSWSSASPAPTISAAGSRPRGSAWGPWTSAPCEP